LEALAALSLTYGIAVVDPELCIECGACIDACPVEAIFFPLEWIEGNRES
jgi:NAD-dependent dihydropyrimidine dehydrogenase PreA subunit